MASWSGLAKRTGYDERRLRLASIAVVALVATVALAGCAGVGGGGGGQSLSDAQVGVEDARPVVAFNYSVNDYATVLLEGPDDNVINEVEVSPDSEQASLYMGDPQPGEYKLVLRQGDNTVTSTTMTFEGANPAVEDVSANWSSASIQSVTVTVRNDGDLPMHVDNGTVTVRGSSFSSSAYKWVEAGGTATFNVTPGFGETEPITEPGEVQGSVEVATRSGTATGSFEKTFDGPEGELSNISTTFLSNYDADTSDLLSARFDVRNTGEIQFSYDSVEISIDGTTRTYSLASEPTLRPGHSTITHTSWSTTVSNGKHDLTIRLLNDGEVVITGTTTVSTSS